MKCFAGLGQQNFRMWYINLLVTELYKILEFSFTVAFIVAKFKLIERTSIQR